MGEVVYYNEKKRIVIEKYQYDDWRNREPWYVEYPLRYDYTWNCYVWKTQSYEPSRHVDEKYVLSLNGNEWGKRYAK